MPNFLSNRDFFRRSRENQRINAFFNDSPFSKQLLLSKMNCILKMLFLKTTDHWIPLRNRLMITCYMTTVISFDAIITTNKMILNLVCSAVRTKYIILYQCICHVKKSFLISQFGTRERDILACLSPSIRGRISPRTF